MAKKNNQTEPKQNDAQEPKKGDETIITNGTTTFKEPENESTTASKGKKKVVMKENVLHDGVRYEKGVEVELDVDTLKVFKMKEFI